jgi:hypothetical protein
MGFENVHDYYGNDNVGSEEDEAATAVVSIVLFINA